MRLHLLLYALAVTSAAGCSGGEFHVDGPLRATPELPVSGALGMNTEHCSKDASKDSPPATGLAADQSASVEIGSLSGVASSPHRSLTSDKLFGEAVLRDYESFLRVKQDPARADRVEGLLVALASDSVAAHDPNAAAQLDQLLTGIHAVLELPRDTTESVAFTFFATRHAHTIAMACRTTEVARFMGVLDGPRFNMTCRIVSNADGVARELRVRGYGSWANYSYAGELRGTAANEVARFASQNVVILGAGGVRGFDLRGSTGGQIAALSFWQVAVSQDKSEPRAWVLPQASPGWEDAVAATLAMSYVFPWPTSCDDQYLRGRSGDAKASP